MRTSQPRPLPKRRVIRLYGHNYASPGFYFVTFCTHRRLRVLGRVERGCVVLSELGTLVSETWSEIPQHFANVAIDAFVAMPDHVHAILVIRPSDDAQQRPTLGQIVRATKARITREAHRRGLIEGRLWHCRYYDRILRSGRAVRCVRRYIEQNPARYRKR
jgi:putative transposase